MVMEDGTIKALLSETGEIADSCMNQIRSASFLMHPPQLGEADLHHAILWLAEGFERRSGMRVRLELAPLRHRLPIDLEAALYRMVQEGLANILRHARGSSVELVLCVSEQKLRLILANHVTIQDESASTMAARGVGLDSMRERLEEFGGNLHVTSSKTGVKLTAYVPVPQEAVCVL
jgi:signal transduction histidine kinase